MSIEGPQEEPGKPEFASRKNFLNELKKEFPSEVPFFGFQLFCQSKRELPAWQNIPISPFYQLGIGDEIVVRIWGEVKLNLRLTVTSSGYVLLPNDERVYVNGLSFGDLEAALLRELRKSYARALSPEELATGTTSMEITLGKIHGIQVLLTGQVSQPGGYTFQSPSVLVMDALAQAGGITTMGSVRAIQIQRGEQIKIIDLYHLIIRGKIPIMDFHLRQGDIVFVPYRNRTVSIQGAVKQPAIYELAEQETLEDLIEMAGGYTPHAKFTHVQIMRIEKNRGSKVVDLNLMERQAATILLQDGDQVEVGSMGEYRRRMFVKIEGSGVRNPGIYQLNEEKENISTLIEGAMLYDDALVERVELIRLEADYSKSSMILDLDEAIQQGFRLQPEDHLTIHSRHQLAGGDKQIHLKGHVKSPGTYTLSQGLKLYDVLFKYGGLTDPDFRAQAYLKRGDILRTDKRTGERRMVPFNLSAVLEKEEDHDLESEDEITIYPADRFKDSMFVTIKGEVRLPGQYALRQEMMLADLLAQAGGLKEEAYTLQAEVNRRNLDGDNPIQTFLTRLDQQEEDFKLRNRDVIFIRRLPHLNKPSEVMIEGELAFPGEYLLTKVNERLSQLIERAGGLSEQAFPEGVQFTRELNGERRSVALDLEKALRGHVEHDIILANGDSIYIPPRNWVVEVKGAVQLPQLVQYVSNQKAKYYVSLVGGYQPNADVNAAYIIRANHLILNASRRFWLDPEVPPGSTLVIPSQTAVRTPLWKRHGIGFIGGVLVSGLAVYWVD